MNPEYLKPIFSTSKTQYAIGRQMSKGERLRMKERTKAIEEIKKSRKV